MANVHWDPLSLVPSLGVVRENQWTVALNVYLWDLRNNFSCSSPVSVVINHGKLMDDLRNNSMLHKKKNRSAL